MNKSVWGPVAVIAVCILLTQSIAFSVSDENNFTLNYIALFTIGLQWIFFIHAGGFFGNERTEKFYDLMGSITFISTTIINSIFSKDYSKRIELLNLLVIFWTIRLGAFLFTRIKNNKGIDSRFTDIKKNNYRFLMTWTLQGVWVFLSILPLLIITQKERNVNFKVLDYIGSILFICGFTFETIADYQKLKFRSESKNKDKFIKSGLWKYSRHPNYFGEILLWFSFALIGYSGSHSLGVFISPVFVALLLIFVSGIPLLEKAADVKFGNNDDYKTYKTSTPVLIPFFGRAGDAMF
jgi:steroid 5-alpha reductase family enzyme